MMITENRKPLGLAEIPGEVIMEILEAVNPEKIICFGIRSAKHESWGCFFHTSETQYSVALDLLILTRPDEKRNPHELLDRLDQFSTATIVINSLIHNINTVREALMNGSHFFTTVLKNGLLLYDNEPVSLVPAEGREILNDQPLTIENVWSKWFDLAQQFLRGASFFSAKGSHNLAAFMLHQAIEHTCIALIRITTGYRPSTHNLRRLIAMTENFTPFATSVFPRNTSEEANLFQVLARAYADVRYKEGYKIDPGTVTILIGRVAAFQCHAENVYRQRKPSI